MKKPTIRVASIQVILEKIESIRETQRLLTERLND